MMDTVIVVTLLAFLVVTAIGVAMLRSLFAAVMLFGIYSLLSAGVFMVMDAADVAFTEAAVGAGIATLLSLATLALTGEEKSGPPSHRPWLPLALVIVTGAALVYGTLDIPAFGDPENPAQQHVAQRYIHDSPDEVGIPNLVTAVLASYRGFDTLGEVVVVFTAGIGVLMLFGQSRTRRSGGQSGGRREDEEDGA